MSESLLKGLNVPDKLIFESVKFGDGWGRHPCAAILGV